MSFLTTCLAFQTPSKTIVLKARQILADLQNGVSLYQLRGRRMSFDRNLIRIPVTYRYRLLCYQQMTQITPLKVMSHETYNSIARNTFR